MTYIYLITCSLKAFLIQFRFQLKAIALRQLTAVGEYLKKHCWVPHQPSTAHPPTQHALLLRFITSANSSRAERSPGMKHMHGSACRLAHISVTSHLIIRLFHGIYRSIMVLSWLYCYSTCFVINFNHLSGNIHLTTAKTHSKTRVCAF